MPIILGNTEVIGARLRVERERLQLSQAEFAQIGGVSRNSQTAYETGKTPFTSDYLGLIAVAGVDPLFIITGTRSAGALSEEEARILSAFENIAPAGRNALLYLACSLAGQPAPAATVTLPSTEALEAALTGFLESSPNLQGAELVRELAMSLPTILRGAADEIDSPRSGRPGVGVEPQSVSGGDRRAGQRGPRT